MELKTNEKNKEKKYFNKLNENLISYHIFPFLYLGEVKKLLTLNKKIHNSFPLFYENLFYNDNNIIKYNIKKSNNSKSKELKDVYELKDDKGHFIKINEHNLEHYLLFANLKWTWKDNDQYKYWDKIIPKNSLLNKNIIYQLNSACFINVSVKMSHIFYGKYNLFLNHCVCNLAEKIIKITILIDDNKIKEFDYPSKEQRNRCRIIHSEKKGNPNEKIRDPFLKVREKRSNIIDYNKDNSLYNECIMKNINIIYNAKRDLQNGHELMISFESIEGSWKKKWLIDGIVLVRKNLGKLKFFNKIEI